MTYPHSPSIRRVAVWCFLVVSAALAHPALAQKSIEECRALRLAARSVAGWEQDAEPGRLIVRFRAEARLTQRSQTLHKAAPLHKVAGENPLTGSLFIELDPSTSLAEAIERLEADPDVEYAEPMWRKQLARIPNDPRFAEQWAFRNTGQSSYGYPTEDSYQAGTPGADIAAPAGWDRLIDTSGLVIAIIDTGVDLTHPDLRDNLWINAGEIPGDEIDNDNNGYVDDVHGYDFAGSGISDRLKPDSDPSDQDGHGTGVAGVALARGDNGIGIAGTAWRGRIMALKVADENGVIYLSAVLSAYAYAARMGAKIVNASFVGTQFQTDEYNALLDLSSKGILVVAAAGNNNLDLRRNPYYPACYELPNIVSVTAVNRRDTLSWFSNYGAGLADLAAPGEGILTTLPNYDPNPAGSSNTSDTARPRHDDDGNGFPEYGGLSGTSFAVPAVTGAAALAWTLNPSLTAAQLRQRLIGSAAPLPTLGPAGTTGGGRLRLDTLLDYATPYTAYATPADLEAGKTTRLLLTGINYSQSAEVSFSGTGVTAQVLSSTTAYNLVLDVTVAPWAERTARSVTVRLPGGAQSTQPAMARIRSAWVTYTDNANMAIPDNVPAGLLRTMTIGDSAAVAALDLRLSIEHPYLGDLAVYLRAPDQSLWTVVYRPGYLQGVTGSDPTRNLDTWFPSSSLPVEPVDKLLGVPVRGDWRLSVGDLAPRDTGKLLAWQLRIADAFPSMPTFPGEAQGWNFSGSIAPFAQPQPAVGNGYLALTSPGTINAFGFWQSQPDWLPALPDTIYRVDYTVATDVAAADRVPLYRVRLTSRDAQVGLLHVMQKNGSGPQTPTPAGVRYSFFTPAPRPTQSDADFWGRYEIAFDLMNIDPRAEPSGQLRFGDLALTRIAPETLADERAELSYAFESGAEGWFSDYAAEYTPPVFSTAPGALTMTAVNNTDTYGVWTSPSVLPLDAGRLYRIRFTVSSTTLERSRIPTLRLRAGDSQYHSSVGMVINSKSDFTHAPARTATVYTLYYAPPAGLPSAARLLLAFDMINIDPLDDPQGTLSLRGVAVDSFPWP